MCLTLNYPDLRKINLSTLQNKKTRFSWKLRNVRILIQTQTYITQRISFSLITHTNNKKTFADSRIIVTVLLCRGSPSFSFPQTNIKRTAFIFPSLTVLQRPALNPQSYFSQISSYAPPPPPPPPDFFPLLFFFFFSSRRWGVEESRIVVKISCM